MDTVVRVEILGRVYSIKSDQGEERVKWVAECLNQKIKEVSGRVKTDSATNVIILAALSIANDYMEAIEQQKKYSQMVGKKSAKIIELIDSQVE